MVRQTGLARPACLVRAGIATREDSRSGWRARLRWTWLIWDHREGQDPQTPKACLLVRGLPWESFCLECPPVLTGPAPCAGNTDTPLLPELRLQPLSELLVSCHLLIILATGGTSPDTGKGFQSVFGSQGPYRICGN